MEFGLAFSFPFQDQDWLKKISIGGLILLIPIVGQLVVFGWGLEIVRRVIRRDPQPLPDWSEFGRYIMDGLLAWIISFLYSIPIIIVALIANVPTFMMTQENADTMGTIAMVLGICASCVVLVYGILLGLWIPAALANFAVKGSFGAAFSFAEILNLVKSAIGAYFLVLVGSIVAGFIAGLGSVACGIGVIFTSAYATAIMCHLIGQAYNVAQGTAVSG